MVNVRNNLTNKQFGRLTVIKQAEDYISPQGIHYSMWLCECSCVQHKQLKVRGSDLTSNRIQSCGCLHDESCSRNGSLSKRYNTYDLTSEDFGIGYTQNGEAFYFDKEDYQLIKNYCWSVDAKQYIVANSSNESQSHIRLHRLVMGVTHEDPNTVLVDHIHGKESRYDNRKTNLRIVTHSQNSMNSAIPSNNTSGVKGVCWHNSSQKWRAYIGVNKTTITLGEFDNFDDAVKVRKDAEKQYFGEYEYNYSQQMEV